MIAACLALTLAAPTPLRLSDLLREAREKNPDLIAAQAHLRAAKESVSPAGALDDPMLMVQLWNAPVDFSSVPVMVQLSQTIPLAGKRGARADAARADAALAQSELLVQQREIETALASACFELFLAEQTQQVDDELETILKVLLVSSETRISSGKGEQVELLRAQGSLVQLRSNRESALDHQQSARARIASLLDRNPAGPAGTTLQPNVLANLPDVGALQKRALQARPELAGARARISSADAETRLARAAAIPDLNLFVAEMHDFHRQGAPSDFLFAGFQINLPIFGGRTSSSWRCTSPRTSSGWPSCSAPSASSWGWMNRRRSDTTSGISQGFRGRAGLVASSSWRADQSRSSLRRRSS